MTIKGVKGVLTFAIGGTILALLYFLMSNSSGNTNFLGNYVVILLGFLGFIFVGMWLYAILDDANKSNQNPK